MHQIRYTLLSDGTSDGALIPILNWVLRYHFPHSNIEGSKADFSFLRYPPSLKNLDERIIRAIELFPCDLLFIHRDAERDSWVGRAHEIDRFLAKISTQINHVKVIPIRMTEAWLLFNENAIKAASGNRNGKVPRLPPLKTIEKQPDPKSILIEALKTSSGKTGRKLDQFNARFAIQRVAELIDDFSPLRGLDAFQRLEKDILYVIKEISLG